MNPPQKRNHRLAPEPPPALAETLRKKGSRRFLLGDPLSRPGSQTKSWFSKPSVNANSTANCVQQGSGHGAASHVKQSQRPEGGARRLGTVRASWSNRRRRKRPHIPFAKTFASDHVRRHQLPVLLHRGAPRASALANATASGPCRTTLAVRNALSFPGRRQLGNGPSLLDCATAPSAYGTRTAVGVSST